VNRGAADLGATARLSQLGECVPVTSQVIPKADNRVHLHCDSAEHCRGVPFRVNQVPNSTRWQIFLRDPNNVEIELNFEVKNEAS